MERLQQGRIRGRVHRWRCLSTGAAAALFPAQRVLFHFKARPLRCKLVEGYFELYALGPMPVKGISEPMNIYEVTGLGPLRTHFQLSTRRGLTRFVGREREVEQITRALELAMGGHGQLVAVVAEAGTGKSRLFYKFKATLPTDCKLLEAYSVSHGKASAWLPVLEDKSNATMRRGGSAKRSC